MLTLAKFKRFLAIDAGNTSKDVELQEFINDAIGEADDVSNRTLEYDTHTVYLDGTGTNEINLSEGPVHEITELKYWDGSDFIDLLEGSDTLADTVIYPGGFKVILKKNYIFPCGSGNIMVSFAAGYKWADAWAANTVYFIDNLVFYNDNLYKCTTAHTSGVTFDITKWETLNVETTPSGLEKAIKYNAALIFYESPAGKSLFAQTSANTGGASSKGTSYDFDKMREYYTKTYESFRIQNV